MTKEPPAKVARGQASADALLPWSRVEVKEGACAGSSHALVITTNTRSISIRTEYRQHTYSYLATLSRIVTSLEKKGSYIGCQGQGGKVGMWRDISGAPARDI